MQISAPVLGGRRTVSWIGKGKTMADVHELLATWIENVTDEGLLAELKAMKEAGDESAITDAFFQDLAFGTAGLRGTLGAGTNRMNIYTVGRATQGFADYLVKNFENPTVAIARDSRNNGELFVKTTAAILAANGVTSYVYPKISPVPTLSWATRYLECSGGICMTASHNPAAYNGYKAYGPDGCQITSEAADAISAAMNACDPFHDVKTMDFDAAVEQGLVKWIGDEVLDAYYDAVAAKSVNNLTPEQIANAPLKLVYTPLNGTGLIPVTTVLNKVGVTDITVVPEQRDPDGDFPTCPYPNPEIREAMQKGIDLCQESYGYLSGDHVRDKDAVNASMLICQMAQYYKLQGLNLVQAMRALYEKYGYYHNKTVSLSYPGADGAAKMTGIMKALRAEAPSEIAGAKVEAVVDYANCVNGLPKADVIEFDLEGGNKAIVRPSGTEPKIKLYIFAKGEDAAAADALIAAIEEDGRKLLS